MRDEKNQKQIRDFEKQEEEKKKEIRGREYVKERWNF